MQERRSKHSCRNVFRTAFFSKLLVGLCGNGMAACQVVLRKIGKRNAKLPAPIPRSGEPEDLIPEAPLLRDKSEPDHIIKSARYTPQRSRPTELLNPPAAHAEGSRLRWFFQ